MSLFKRTHRFALHYAASCGCVEVCRAILRKGGNPNVVDKHKLTPAHEAAAKGHFEVKFTLAYIYLLCDLIVLCLGTSIVIILRSSFRCLR